MHAVLVTFKSAASTEELADPFREYAEALRAVPGLVSKTWIKAHLEPGVHRLLHRSFRRAGRPQSDHRDAPASPNGLT